MAKGAPRIRKPATMWIDALAATAGIENAPHRTLLTVVAEYAKSQPHAPALLSDRETLDYAALQGRIDLYARWAASQGIEKGDCVALFMPNQPDYVAIWLGIAAAGGITALINANLTGAALTHAVGLARPRLSIVAADLHDTFAGCAALLPDDIGRSPSTWLHGDGPAQFPRIDQFTGPAPAPGVEITIDDPALLIYTSGTTGLPKAARVSHRRIMNWSLWFKGMLGATAEDRLYDCLPLYHSVGGAVAVGSMLAAGGAVAIAGKFSASRFWDEILRFDCTLFQYIGELCRYLVHSPKHPVETRHRLRMAVGNGLRGDVWECFQKRFGIPQILEFYASTEGNFSLYNAEGKPGAIGRIPPFLSHRFPIAIVRFDAGRGVPSRGENGFCMRTGPGEAGEALGRIGARSAAAGRFEGYTDAVESERKILRNVFETGDAWFRSGDLMRVDATGFYHFVDRAGDTFRWKGENVSTAEVAETISAAPGVVEAVVYGVEVPGFEGRAGMAMLTVDKNFDLVTFRNHVRANLPSYAVPVFLRVGDGIAVTDTFKHKKQDLVREGFNPSVCGDPLYVEDALPARYAVIDATMYIAIMAGNMRL